MDEMINVKTQMPPDHVEVLLYDTAGRYRVGWWWEAKQRYGGDVPQYAVITHWCPLPPRPFDGRDPAFGW